MKMQPPVKREFPPVTVQPPPDPTPDDEEIIVLPQLPEKPVNHELSQLQNKQNNQGKGGGHPAVITEAVVLLLVAAFQNGLDVRSACVYAGIGKTAYYKKYKEDSKFADTMERAKNNLVELSGARLAGILSNGSDRDAGPIAMKIFEKRIPELYGNVTINNNQQNNFYGFNPSEISNIAKQPDLSAATPSELLETLETESQLDTGSEEGSVAPVYQETVQRVDTEETSMPQSPSTV